MFFGLLNPYRFCLIRVNSRKATAGNGALEVYAIAKRLALNPRSTTLSSHAGNLKRDLGKRGRKKVTKPAPGTPVPVPVPPVPVPVPPAPISTIPMLSNTGGLSAERQA